MKNPLEVMTLPYQKDGRIPIYDAPPSSIMHCISGEVVSDGVGHTQSYPKPEPKRYSIKELIKAYSPSPALESNAEQEVPFRKDQKIPTNTDSVDSPRHNKSVRVYSGNPCLASSSQRAREKIYTIRINNPAKGSLPRIVKVTAKTIAMLKALSKTREYIFNPNVATIRKSFMKQRKRIAETLQNSKLKQIHFHTFRHWKATMEYHRTKDILHVKQLLGHKQLKNTEIYTHLINFKSDEWHVDHAKNLDEESKLIESGFEYVRYSGKDEVAIYRKT